MLKLRDLKFYRRQADHALGNDVWSLVINRKWDTSTKRNQNETEARTRLVEHAWHDLYEPLASELRELEQEVLLSIDPFDRQPIEQMFETLRAKLRVPRGVEKIEKVDTGPRLVTSQSHESEQ